MRVRCVFGAMGSLLVAIGLASVRAAGDAAPVERAGVIDIQLSDLEDLEQNGRLGLYPSGVVGLSFAVTGLNNGTLPIDWYGTYSSPMDPRHPFIGQNLFHLRSGRLEQIGLAWVKHGNFPLNDPSGCAPQGSRFLGVGCSDTYGAPTNARWDLLGPRSEVNPFTGFWQPCGSHFDTGAIGYSVPGDCNRSQFYDDPSHTDTVHQLRVSDADLLATDINPATVPSTWALFIEGFYVVAGDQNVLNNFRWRPMNAVEDVVWTFTDRSPEVNQCIIFSWGELQSVAAPATTGMVVAATRAVNLGGGQYRYEYNVYNLNKNGGVVSFSVPVAPAIDVSGFGFHAPLENEDTQFDMGAWTAQRTANSVLFAAPPHGAAAYRNSIRYGTMYTFWFNAQGAPSNGQAILEWDTLGAPDGSLTAIVRRPAAAGCPADANGDGMVNSSDLGLLLGAWGASSAVSDVNADGVVNSTDLGLLLGGWGPCP